MFGKNKIAKLLKGNGDSLEIVKIFPTIQGEGPYAGIPAIFIRLGGCNLACTFCDTEFDEYTATSLQGIIKQVQDITKNSSIKLAVITGGEPLRQPVSPLCKSLQDLGLKVQIETNGTLLRDLPENVSIVCSPKNTQGKYIISEELLNYATCFKFIISKHNKNYGSIPTLNTSKEIYIQPMDEYDLEKNSQNVAYAIELALKFNYRLSLQIHKIMNIE